jgi:hypothetical protein
VVALDRRPELGEGLVTGDVVTPHRACTAPRRSGAVVAGPGTFESAGDLFVTQPLPGAVSDVVA